MRILMGVSYKGTAYCGWQRQTNALSVQEVLASTWQKVTGEKVTLHGSGRTDAGVHAICQPVHLDTDTSIPLDKLPFALNVKLPPDIRVLWAKEVSPTFHARFDVVRKTYVYKLYWGPHADPFLTDTYCHVVARPDVDKMKQAAQVLLGEHDFKAMQATGGHVKSTVRTLYRIDVKEDANRIEIEVEGNGFLYNMVRILAGTLVYAGWGWLTPEEIARALEAKDRTGLGKTLPPEGLYLKEVVYP